MNGLSHRAHPVDIQHRHFLEHDSMHFINGWFVVVGFPLRKKSYWLIQVYGVHSHQETHFNEVTSGFYWMFFKKHVFIL